jgi:F0F1-type ATP synthase membrane subunit b/b'
MRSESIARIDRWTNWLTWLLVAIPFALSFGALADLAAAQGVTYPYLFPLMVDAGLVVFNLVALRASLRGQRSHYAWTLVVMATAVSVLLNVVHAQPTLLSRFMAALPPVFILLVFHLVVTRIESDARDQAVAGELVSVHERLTHARADLAAVVSEHDQMSSAMNSLRDAMNSLRAEQRQLLNSRDQRAEQAVNSQQQTPAPDVDARRQRLLELAQDDAATHADMATALGVSISTVRRDLRALNGRVKAR